MLLDCLGIPIGVKSEFELLAQYREWITTQLQFVFPCITLFITIGPLKLDFSFRSSTCVCWVKYFFMSCFIGKTVVSFRFQKDAMIYTMRLNLVLSLVKMVQILSKPKQ